MQAIVLTGGKQYRVQEGDVITVEKLNAEVGAKVELDVMALGEGKDMKFGSPLLAEKVEAEVVEHGKGQKVIIFKYKAKKDYRKKQGHRQPYTMLKICGLAGTTKAAPKAAKAEKASEAVEEAKAVKVSLSMKKDELIAVAKANGIEVNEKATKAVIVETIEAALK